MKLWIVGQWRGRSDDGVCWDFQGVFDTEDAAIKACVKDLYFVGPVELHELLSDDSQDWPGCYYPRLEDRPEDTSA